MSFLICLINNACHGRRKKSTRGRRQLTDVGSLCEIIILSEAELYKEIENLEQEIEKVVLTGKV